MNSQDFRSFQEAYLEVYQELDEADGSYDGPTPKALKRAQELAKERILAAQGNIFSKRNNKKINKRAKGIQDVTRHLDRMTLSHRTEQVDLYDLILSHLLDEGYAETPEAAEAIMVNMSEDWRESICEGMKPLPVEKMDAKAKELKSKFRKSKVGTPEASKLLSRLGHIVAARDSKVG